MRNNSITSEISDEVKQLPVNLQAEVLDFVQHLKNKLEKEADLERNEWLQVSIENGLKGIEDDPVFYTDKDIM